MTKADTTVRVRISNTEPRRDNNGEILHAIEGTLLQVGNRFYFYGITFADKTQPALMRCSTSDYVRCYSSSDLNHWVDHGSVLVDRQPDEFMITPKVIYNRQTGKFVMWYNVLKSLWNGEMNVATSDRPEGPFVTQKRNVELGFEKPGCVGLFVDEDDAAYIIYNTHQDHLSQIERLTDDYLSGTGEVSASPVVPEKGEGQILFRRGDTYYLIQGRTCCYCPQGTNSLVYTSENPLGPYIPRNEINPIRADGSGFEIPGQLFGVTEIQTPTGPEFIWLATCWQTPPDGVVGHDFTYWSPPLQFEPDGNIAPMRWTESYELTLAANDFPKNKLPKPELATK